MATAKPYALVVEGDPHNLIAMSALLRELKVPFKRNTTGDGVLAQLRHMHPRPNVVLMALNLPEGDAYSIASALRSDPDLAPVRLVAIGPDQPQPSDLERAGFDGFIATPLPRRLFSGLLKRLMAGEHVYSAPI